MVSPRYLAQTWIERDAGGGGNQGRFAPRKRAVACGHP
jgi:hypothetical protein